MSTPDSGCSGAGHILVLVLVRVLVLVLRLLRFIADTNAKTNTNMNTNTKTSITVDGRNNSDSQYSDFLPNVILEVQFGIGPVDTRCALLPHFNAGGHDFEK